MLDEWRQRLDDVLLQNRASEVKHLHDWMDIAFGRSGEKRPRPLDLRIHSRLGEIYMKAREYERAIEQLEQARDLAPRDIFVLRTLGTAYLERNDRPAVQAVLERIGDLDQNAFRHNRSAPPSPGGSIGRAATRKRRRTSTVRPSEPTRSRITSPILSLRPASMPKTARAPGRRTPGARHLEPPQRIEPLDARQRRQRTLLFERRRGPRPRDRRDPASETGVRSARGRRARSQHGGETR